MGKSRGNYVGENALRNRELRLFSFRLALCLINNLELASLLLVRAAARHAATPGLVEEQESWEEGDVKQEVPPESQPGANAEAAHSCTEDAQRGGGGVCNVK